MKKPGKEIETPEAPDMNEAAAAAAEAVDPGSLSLEQIQELQAQAAKAAGNWDRLVRISADFENFKKRAARERQDAIKYANESLFEKLIPIMDSFDMAVSAAQAAPEGSAQSLQEGVRMISQQLKSALQAAGLEEVDANGKPFDPNLHEAVAQQESAGVAEGTVLQQLRKGYKFRDRLLRPATVVVAKSPAA